MCARPIECNFPLLNSPFSHLIPINPPTGWAWLHFHSSVIHIEIPSNKAAIVLRCFLINGTNLISAIMLFIILQQNLIMSCFHFC